MEFSAKAVVSQKAETEVKLPIEIADLAYYPAPKNACSSVKLMMRELETGEPVPEPEREYIHEWRDSPLYASASPGLRSFCIVRDPVERFISAFRNRVHYHYELHEESVDAPKIAAMGLAFNPDLATFADNLDAYMGASMSIAHHFWPQACFLGSDLSLYDRVFHLHEVSQVAEYILEHTGRRVHAYREQTGGPVIEATDEIKAYVSKRYMGDYALLKGMYDPIT